MARPTFKPTPTQRRAVAIAAGGGANHEAIACGLGIARNTLEKHFAEELSNGAFQKRLEIIQAVFRAAKKGNVAAAKTYLALDPKTSAPPRPKAEVQPKTAQLGKKEQAAVDAVSAAVGTEWSDLLAPRAPMQ